MCDAGFKVFPAQQQSFQQNVIAAGKGIFVSQIISRRNHQEGLPLFFGFHGNTWHLPAL